MSKGSDIHEVKDIQTKTKVFIHEMFVQFLLEDLYEIGLNYVPYIFTFVTNGFQWYGIIRTINELGDVVRHVTKVILCFSNDAMNDEGLSEVVALLFMASMISKRLISQIDEQLKRLVAVKSLQNKDQDREEEDDDDDGDEEDDQDEDWKEEGNETKQKVGYFTFILLSKYLIFVQNKGSNWEETFES